jgi:hypothetical protein
MGEVIDMMTRHPRSANGGRSAARARALDVARTRGDRFESADQLRAAANLHLLLEEAERKLGVRKVDIARAVGLGGDGGTDSTKRLQTYTLPPDSSDTRKRQIAKKPGKYFDFAVEIARRTGQSTDDCLCRIFEGCSFGQKEAASHDASWAEERWSHLAGMLRDMAGAVVRSEGVAEYLALASQVKGNHEIGAARIVPSAWSLDKDGGTNDALDGYVCHPADLGPIPSVLLGERWQDPAREGLIVLADGRLIEAEFRLALEVRLALARAHHGSPVGAMLEFRSRIDAGNAVTGKIGLDEPWTTGMDEGQRVDRVCLDGAWFAVAEFPEFDWGEPEQREGTSHHNFMWREVTPVLLRDLFGSCPEPRSFQMVNARRGELPARAEVNRFGPEAGAFWLWDRLVSGGLEEELVRECRRCRSMLDDHIDLLDQRAAEAESEARRRWAAMKTGHRDPRAQLPGAGCRGANDEDRIESDA